MRNDDPLERDELAGSAARGGVMGYKLQQRGELSGEVRRIVAEQLDKASDQLERGYKKDLDEAVHDVRKRMKKVRAVLRLVRDALGRAYRVENRCFRDLGRDLAPLRDAHVMVQTAQRLQRDHRSALDTDAIAPLVEHLVRQRERVHASAGADRFARLARTLAEARRRIADWPLSDGGFALIEPGLARVYRRGRKALARAYDEGSPKAFHDWRKRAKYLRYQVRIVAPIWPAVFGAYVDELHRLTDLLGEAHDLHSLDRAIAADQTLPPAAGPAAETVRTLATGARLQLEQRARPLAERLYADETKAFIKRVAACFEAG